MQILHTKTEGREKKKLFSLFLSPLSLSPVPSGCMLILASVFILLSQYPNMLFFPFTSLPDSILRLAYPIPFLHNWSPSEDSPNMLLSSLSFLFASA